MPDNRVYTIGEASDILGVSISTLRMYERMGLVIPQRRQSKHRLFTSDDLDRVALVRELIKHRKLTLADIRNMLAGIPCWEITNCPDELQNVCEARVNRSIPCWLSPRRARLCPRTDCRQCNVYAVAARSILSQRSSDIPVAKQQQVR